MNNHALNSRTRLHTLNAALLWSFLTVLANAATDEHLTKNFTVQPGGKLVVQVDMGSIDVSTNAGNTVGVDVWRKIGRSKKTDEEAYLRDHPVEFNQAGDTVTVRCRSKLNNSSWNFAGKMQNEAKYTISVPAKFNAKLETSGGGISVSDLTGEVKADSSAGSLKFSRLHGSLTGTTSGGGIHLTDCEGEIGINTSAGGISIAGGSGSLKADSSGGAITVKQFRGPASMHTSAGGITLEQVTGGEIRADTSGGGIKAALPSPLAGPIKLETSAGGITLHLAASAAFDLDAETSAGTVISELPVTSTAKHSHGRLKGSVNGGGQPMYLRSSAGSIHILKSDRLLAEEPK